jgi:hypothetical protein
MAWNDVPTYEGWILKTGWTEPQVPAGRDLYLSKIAKLIRQYHQVLPMAKYHTLLDLNEALIGWKVKLVPPQSLREKEAFTWLADVVEDRLMAYPPRTYDAVVFAGYCLKTGTATLWNAGTPAEKWLPDDYMGYDDPAQDVEARCRQMIAAIQAAISKYETDVKPAVRDDSKTLKLFMAPEFYFRGKAGAYTTDLLIGVEAKPHRGWWDRLTGSGKGTPGIMDHLRVETQKHPDWLFVLGTFVVGSEETGVACRNAVHSAAWMVPDVAAWDPSKRVLTCPHCRGQLWCAKCKTLLTVFKPQTNPPKYWNADRDYHCPKCKRRAGFREAVNSIVIDNYAMVQKGGYSTGDGIHDYCTQKEYVSDQDFHQDKPSRKGYKLFGKWRERSGPPKNYDGQTADPRKQERMGGSVFTMDGITFGLEICLDHHEHRLVNSEANNRIQIQLIPSAAMTIESAGDACMANGWLFNVDGDRGDAKVNAHGQVGASRPSRCQASVRNCASQCFPDAANQHVELFGPFDIP